MLLYVSVFFYYYTTVTLGFQRCIQFIVYTDNCNAVMIYYKGFSAPIIHYCPENGIWTGFPGVAMIPDTSRAGFTNSYSDSAYANVCFNDGHGSWDSRNGANYRFTQGTYKFSNGNITAM